MHQSVALRVYTMWCHVYVIRAYMVRVRVHVRGHSRVLCAHMTVNNSVRGARGTSPAPTAGRMRVGTNPEDDADDDADADADADPPRTRERDPASTSEEEEAALVSSLK